ncbi:MAG: hypothetical protein M5U34_07840 [Chloroflexi bacterium]|nr:hypothetical protein [Chloroflexota bacterium]
MPPGRFPDLYWEPAAMQEVDKFCTDDLAQFEYYKSVGYFSEKRHPSMPIWANWWLT